MQDARSAQAVPTLTLRLFLPSSCSLHLAACDLILTHLFHPGKLLILKEQDCFLLKFSWEMFQCQKDMSSLTIAHSHADTKGIYLPPHLKVSFPQGMEKKATGGEGAGAVPPSIVIFLFVPDLDCGSLYTRVVSLYWMEVEFFAEK